VTSSSNEIKIWNYETMTLEQQMTTMVNDEVYAVAFHPNGFHIVVAFAGQVQVFNILTNSIAVNHTYNDLKTCRELRFSNGGQYIACADSQNKVHIINFLTGEMPPILQRKGHGKVRSIKWFEDDSGFVTAAVDGNCYFYELQALKETEQRTTEMVQRGYCFTGMDLMPGNPFDAICVGPAVGANLETKIF
jgi:WD40 repeat protein